MSKVPKEWSKTVDEAVAKILSEMPEKDRSRLKSTPEDDLINFHFGLGMFIRNEFGLWAGNKKLLNSCGSETMHPDDASTVITKAVWKKLNEK